MTRSSLTSLLAAAVLAVAAVTTGVALATRGVDDPAADARTVVDKKAPDVLAAPAVVLAPSGLPVGLLESKVTRSGGDVDVSNIRLLVRADGTGAYSPPGGHAGDGGGGYPVVYSAPEPGRVSLRYDGIVCADPRALTLAFTVDGGVVTITGAERHGCLVGTDLVADLVGATFRLTPANAVPTADD
jgi:hypothetical protein